MVTVWYIVQLFYYFYRKRFMQTDRKIIYAHYDDETIRVYQAYSDDIAESALAHGKFIAPPFKMTRMTWIKPSFLWMMYRAGWGYKDANQKRILAIDITHDGFLWALNHACLSHAPAGMDAAAWQALKSRCPVRIQWDPERDIRLNPLTWRAIQIGLSGEAVFRYVNEWAVRIMDITPLAHDICRLVAEKQFGEAQALLPQERIYAVTQAAEMDIFA